METNINTNLSDLEEAASRYAKEEYSHKSPATLPDRCRGCYAPLMYAFKAGAEWKKNQLIAKSVDGVITFDYYGNDNKTYGCIAHDSFCLEDIGLKDTDKVKMIIVKDEMS